MQFAVALSRAVKTESAAQAVAEDIQAQLGSTPIDFACVFFSAHHAAAADRLASVLTRTLRPNLLIGCSGEGVIAEAEELETVPAIAVWAAVLPDVHLHPLQSWFSPTHDQFHLSGWPEPGVEEASFLLFADPFTVPVQDILRILEERYPAKTAVGGLAGGGQEIGMNRLLLNDHVFDRGLVGVRLTGAVDIRPIISQGCRLIGDRFVVTRAERNLIHELGGAPALERLQALFGSLTEEDQRRTHRALHLGIAIDEHRNRFERGDFLIRNLLGADRTTGAIAIGDMVQEGQTVQFHLRDAESATEDLNSLLVTDRADHRHPPLGALMFSCCGRGRRLFGRPNHDVAATMEHLGPIPIAGFFAQGEIGPIGNRNFLHGYTASLALFAERDA
ncbi:MAG TPA: FIST N-terminal domain-containing protein [Nitrospira sp.]|nr:FIST N-terminal domain-containing protein [Nitrospira sp.]